jgi:flagellar protein FlaC
MGIDILKKVLKKEEKEEEKEEEVMPEEPVMEGADDRSEDDDALVKLNERLNDIENRLPRIDVSLNNLKREIDGLRNDLMRIDDSMKDMMTLYEVVSAQINPFVGTSKVTALSVERLDRMERKLEELEDLLDNIQYDLRLIFRSGIDLKEIVNEVLYEEVFSE